MWPCRFMLRSRNLCLFKSFSITFWSIVFSHLAKSAFGGAGAYDYLIILLHLVLKKVLTLCFKHCRSVLFMHLANAMCSRLVYPVLLWNEWINIIVIFFDQNRKMDWEKKNKKWDVKQKDKRRLWVQQLNGNSGQIGELKRALTAGWIGLTLRKMLLCFDSSVKKGSVEDRHEKLP